MVDNDVVENFKFNFGIVILMAVICISTISTGCFF